MKSFFFSSPFFLLTMISHVSSLSGFLFSSNPNPSIKNSYLSNLEHQNKVSTRQRIDNMGNKDVLKQKMIRRFRLQRSDMIERRRKRIKTVVEEEFERPIDLDFSSFPFLNETSVRKSPFFHGFRDQNDAPTVSESGTFSLQTNTQEYNMTRVGGYHQVKQELFQILDLMKDPDMYSQYGVRIPRGILLEGPPGNGKTLLAKCLAGHVDMNFISCSGSEFNEKYVGVGARRIRELFDFAKRHEPCIIFIDEIDALGRSRSGDSEGASAERDQTLNQLLIMMDGFSSSDRVFVVAATNRMDILDKALLRPGRMDKLVHVPNPDPVTRREILEIHSLKKPLDVSMEYMLHLTNGFSGAQIENFLNEAVLFAIRNQSLPITAKALDYMKEKLMLGHVSSHAMPLYSPDFLRRIAIHEVGHLVMALFSSHYEKPWKITIESMNPKHSLGYTIFESREAHEGIFVREYLEDQLKVLLGGRAAEHVFYRNSTSSGAVSDLTTAFGLAKKMVLEYGMGQEIIYPHFSESSKERIDDQIKRFLDHAYESTVEEVKRHRELVEAFATELLRCKTMDQTQINNFLETYDNLNRNLDVVKQHG